MTAQPMNVITKADLATITLVCPDPDCGTRVTVKPQATLIDTCPACRVKFDKAAQDAQLAFQKLCTALTDTTVLIEFQIRAEAPR